MGTRSTVNDGFENRLEFYLLTHFGGLWHLAQGIPWLRRTLNRRLLNSAINKTPPRPYPFSCMAPYTSWDSLTDRTYSGRHLPPDPQQQVGLPSAQETAELFRRTETRLSPKSTVLFPYFAQWFTDGFLRSERPEDPNQRRDVRKNQSAHNIDLSQLYGLKPEITRMIRSGTGGRLKSQLINGEEYPPYLCENGQKKPEFQNLPVFRFNQLSASQRNELFAMGGDRANSQIGYLMLNILFMREHNRIAGKLAAAHPNWDDEQLFQTARNVLIVILIRIVIEEYINHIAPYHFQFYLDATAFPNERWYRQNWMTVEFNLLYRWHSLIPSRLTVDETDLPLERTMWTSKLISDHGLGALFQSASGQPAGKIGLFNTDPGLLDTELASILTGREVQLAPYNAYRAICHFPKVTEFDQISGDSVVQQRLKALYGSVDRIDFYVGLFAEEIRPNSALPSLLGRLVGIDAFSQALTNPLLAPSIYNECTFSREGLEIIENTRSLSDLLHRNLPAGSGPFRVSMTQAGWKRQ